MSTEDYCEAKLLADDDTVRDPATSKERLLALIQQTQLGNASACDALADRLSCIPRMIVYLNRNAGYPLGPHEVEDLAQSTFVSIWAKRTHYDGSRPLETWAFRFCHLEFLAALRRKRRNEKQANEVPDRAVRSWSKIIEYESLYKGLEQLRPMERQVVRSRHFDGLTFPEIATAHDLPLGSVKTHYYRGLARLRRLISIDSVSFREDSP